MIVTQTTAITFSWEEHDKDIANQLMREGFQCEMCTAGITYSKTRNTSWKLGKENE